MEEWAESITKVYEDCTDALMVNIARHFRFGDRFPVGQTDYQFRLLAEMGQLTSESVDIIAEHTGNKNELIREALEGAADAATKDLDAAFAAAIRDGYFTTSGSIDKASPAVQAVLQSYQAQAVEKTNLVNTVMLESTLNAYRRTITNMAVIEQRMAAKAAQLDKAQEILNSATGEVVLGVSSRQEAARKAVRQMAREGLTGFIDRGGHHWSPEAYVNMDIRTTAGNVATESTFARNQDYGNDLIWVPVLTTARPQCYPYQGKVYSTTNRSGFVEDLNGNRIPFEPLSSTTYQQEPAGLFGINCHHTPPNPFIPGFSVVRGNVPPKSVNDKRYAESQEQRRLEREVRYARRDAAIADAMGDKEAFDKAAVKVKEREREYRQYVKATGRTERLDRMGTFGYDKTISRKVRQAEEAQFRAAVNKIGMAGTLLPAPPPIDVSALGFDAEHINTKRQHNVTREQAEGFIEAAVVAFAREIDGENFINYYSRTGATYVNMDTMEMRTAYGVTDFRGKNIKLLEVMKKYGR